MCVFSFFLSPFLSFLLPSYPSFFLHSSPILPSFSPPLPPTSPQLGVHLQRVVCGPHLCPHPHVVHGKYRDSTGGCRKRRGEACPACMLHYGVVRAVCTVCTVCTVRVTDRPNTCFPLLIHLLLPLHSVQVRWLEDGIASARSFLSLRQLLRLRSELHYRASL